MGVKGLNIRIAAVIVAAAWDVYDMQVWYAGDIGKYHRISTSHKQSIEIFVHVLLISHYL